MAWEGQAPAEDNQGWEGEAPKVQPKKPGAFETVKNIGRVIPALESAASLATSAYGIPASGIAGLASLPFGVDSAAKMVDRVQNALIYKPQTSGGQQLTEAAAYPMTKANELGEWAGGKIENPDLAATAHSLIAASPILMAGGKGLLRKGPADIAASERILNSAIDKGIEKSIRPSVEGKRTFAQAERYKTNAREAVKTIVDNKDALALTNEAGEIVKGKLPQSLKEFSQSIDQNKALVFNEYNKMAKEAGKQGATVDLSSISSELDKISKDSVVSDMNPQIANYAGELAETLKNRKSYRAEEAQTAIATLNNKLDSFYKNPSYENASKAYIDSLVANNLRKNLDSVIEGLTGKEYQELKNKYGALKTIERDVNRRTIVDARKNVKGLIDFSDIFSGYHAIKGILSIEPSQVAAGLGSKAIAYLYRMRNDPNRIVKGMFSDVEKQTGRGKNPFFVSGNPKDFMGESSLEERLGLPAPAIQMPGPKRQLALPAPFQSILEKPKALLPRALSMPDIKGPGVTFEESQAGPLMRGSIEPGLRATMPDLARAIRPEPRTEAELTTYLRSKLTPRVYKESTPMREENTRASAPTERPTQQARPYAYEGEGYRVVQLKESGSDQATRWRIDIGRKHREALDYVAGLVEQGEAGSRFRTEPSFTGEQEWIGISSSYPDFMKDQGWTKKQVTGAIDKAIRGEPLGIQQTQIVEKALDFSDDLLYERSKRSLVNEGISEAEVARAHADATASFAKEMGPDLAQLERQAISEPENVRPADIQELYDFFDEVGVKPSAERTALQLRPTDPTKQEKMALRRGTWGEKYKQLVGDTLGMFPKK